MAAVHPVFEALAEHPEGSKFTPVVVTGEPGRVIFYSYFPIALGRQAFVKEVAEDHLVGFYPFICVKAKTFGDKNPALPFDEYARDVLVNVPAKVIVLIGTKDPDIRGKLCVELSRPPSLKEAGGDQKKLTELWENWFKGQWNEVLRCINTHIDTKAVKQGFFKRKADGELKGPETKTLKEEPLKCVEEPLDFTR